MPFVEAVNVFQQIIIICVRAEGIVNDNFRFPLIRAAKNINFFFPVDKPLAEGMLGAIPDYHNGIAGVLDIISEMV